MANVLINFQIKKNIEKNVQKSHKFMEKNNATGEPAFRAFKISCNTNIYF